MRKAGRNREAETLLRRTRDIKDTIFGADSVEVAYTLQELGVCSQAAGRIREAEVYLRRALAVQEAHGMANREMAHTMFHLGVCLGREEGVGHSYEEAEVLLRRAIDIER